MSISGANGIPNPNKGDEIVILPKINQNEELEKEAASIYSVVEDLKVTKEESAQFGLDREYDLTKAEDVEAFQKDSGMHVVISEMIDKIKKQKEEMQNKEDSIAFGLLIIFK